MDKKINLEWYKTFKEIYKNKTITEAANKLNLSQPAVSLQLNSLEKVLNKKLFTRTPRKMVPTEYAKMIYAQIADLIEKLENVELLIETHKPKIINIGCPHEFFDSFIIEKLNSTDFKFNVEFGTTYDLLEKLKNKDLNLVIATKKFKDFDFIYQEIYLETILLIANKDLNTNIFDNYLANQNYEMAENFLLNLDCYAYSSDLPLIKRFWKNNFNKRPVNMIPKAIIPNLKSIVKAISLNQNSFSLIPDYLCKNEIESGFVKEIWEGKKLTTNKIYLCYSRDFEYQKIFSELLNKISFDTI